MFTVSACVWCLKGDATASVRRLRSAGFDSVDLRPDCWEGIGDAGHLQQLGVTAQCAGITPITMAPGLSLNSLATPDADRALPYLTGALERASRLGAKWAYMVTPTDRVGDNPEYARSMSRLADAAERLEIKLCVEPSPGRALGNYTEVTELLAAAGAPNLYALVDLGHLLLTGEDPAGTVRMLGKRTGYVHIDDNDGKADRHFGLLEGVLTAGQLQSFLDALVEVEYDAPLGAEISNALPSPVSSLAATRDYVAWWAERRASA